MRHLALAYPLDEGSIPREDEYLFGPDLLAAPVFTPGATERDLYLPPASWIDFWRALSYRAKPGDLRLRRARVLAGRRLAKLPAPLDELPLLIRAGAVLPLLPADVDTLASYGPGANAVPLSRAARAARPDRLSARSVARHLPRRGAARVARAPRPLGARGARQAPADLFGAGVARHAAAAVPALLGEPGKLRYDRKTRVLRVTFRARAATLTVKAC